MVQPTCVHQLARSIVQSVDTRKTGHRFREEPAQAGLHREPVVIPHQQGLVVPLDGGMGLKMPFNAGSPEHPLDELPGPLRAMGRDSSRDNLLLQDQPAA